jgi:predicted metal-dependent hydrolase
MKKPNPQLSLRLDAPPSNPLAPWCDGARLAYLGTALMVRLSTGREAVERDGVDLHITLPPQATPRQLRDCAEAWLRDEARRLIESAVIRHAARLGLALPRWSLSFAARAHWAQADAEGTLRFHWRLIEQPAAIVDQVVSRAVAALTPVTSDAELFSGLGA